MARHQPTTENDILPPLNQGCQTGISAILRRHMETITWAEAFEKLAESRNIHLGRGGDRKSTATVAIDKADALAREIGKKSW